jgi:hypothetical protein
MKNILPLYSFFLFVSLLASSLATGQVKQQTIESNIDRVTVFINGAQVTRTAKVNLQTGTTELLFAGISPNIDKQSIQVKGGGNFTILSVIHQNNYFNEQKRTAEISLLERQKTAVVHQMEMDKKMLAVFINEEGMLVKNQQIGGTTSGIKTEDLKTAVDFHRSRMTEVYEKQLEIKDSLQLRDDLIRKIENQLKELHQQKNLSTGEVIVTVTSNTALNASFELSYYVVNAGWYVNYDLRVADILHPVDLALKANVFQHSGEDWNNVHLTISNGDPSENGVAPDLRPWYLRFGMEGYTAGTYKASGPVPGDWNGNMIKGKVVDGTTNEGLAGAMVLVKGTSIGCVTDIDGNYAIRIPVNPQSLVVSYIGYGTQEVPANASVINIIMQEGAVLNEMVIIKGSRAVGNDYYVDGIKTNKGLPLETKESYKPTTFSYDIEVPYTILNNGKVNTIEVKRLDIPAVYEYYTAPKLEKAAFLTAKITDWQSINLLDGEISLFFEGAYLGKSILDTQIATDTLNISLGKDKSIIVDRKPLKDFSKKQFLSNFKTETRGFEITIRNNKQQDIFIEVQDQFPISTNNTITVEEIAYKEAELSPDTKILTWRYSLVSKQEKKHIIQYSVKYPKNEIVILE